MKISKLKNEALYRYGIYTTPFDISITLFPSNIEIDNFSIENSFYRVSDAFLKTGESMQKALKDAELIYGKR